MDLYNIPGDTGGKWRLNKFVEYQHEVPALNYRFLGEYIKKHILDKDDAVMMCWYMSATYNEITCVLLQEIFDWRSLTPTTVSRYCNKFWKKYKDVLDFGSSRKYAKNMDWFPILMEDFIRVTKKHPYKWLKSILQNDPTSNYYNLMSTIQQIRFTGRFAGNLFVEAIEYLQEYFEVELFEPPDLDWKDGSNLTSGLLNIFYMDEEANEYDKNKKLCVSPETLTEYLSKVQSQIEKTYPEQDSRINMFVTKICSFRNLFKGSRYGGFHHDRELGVIRAYEQTLPQFQFLWDKCFKLRRVIFQKRFLGELNGWDGIRKERKKLWLRKGLTGVEEVDT